MATAKQTAANRLNAQKSTGPKTDAGKRNGRCNASKHGLTGSGAGMTDKQREEVDSEVEEFCKVLKPQDHVESRCVARMALATLRIFRIHKEDESRTGRRRRAAMKRWDKRREAEVARHAAALPSNPAGSVAALRATAEGCNWLADQWDDLLTALEAGGPLGERQAARAIRLLGLAERPDIHGDPYLAGFTLDLLAATEPTPRFLLAQYFPGLCPEDVAELTPTPEAARASLLARVRAHSEELTALGEQLWERQDGPDRAGAADRVLVDTSPTGARLDRYTTAAGLDYQRAQRGLDAARKERRKLAEEGLPHRNWDGPRNEPISDVGPASQVREKSAVTASDPPAPAASPRAAAAPAMPPPVAFPEPPTPPSPADSSGGFDPTAMNPPPPRR